MNGGNVAKQKSGHFGVSLGLEFQLRSFLALGWRTFLPLSRPLHPASPE